MFNCLRCGCCCRNAGCKYLTKDNLCAIYETRPILCRVDRMFELTGGKDILEKTKYYNLIKRFCEFLRKEGN